MRLPVPTFLATEDTKLEFADGSDENGALHISTIMNVKSRLVHKSETIYTNEGVKVTIKAKAYIFNRVNDIPDDAFGYCTINNYKYDIASVNKLRNPDGSVHHIVMGLM